MGLKLSQVVTIILDGGGLKGIVDRILGEQAQVRTVNKISGVSWTEKVINR